MSVRFLHFRESIKLNKEAKGFIYRMIAEKQIPDDIIEKFLTEITEIDDIGEIDEDMLMEMLSFIAEEKVEDEVGDINRVVSSELIN